MNQMYTHTHREREERREEREVYLGFTVFPILHKVVTILFANVLSVENQQEPIRFLFVVLVTVYSFSSRRNVVNTQYSFFINLILFFLRML